MVYPRPQYLLPLRVVTRRQDLLGFPSVCQRRFCIYLRSFTHNPALSLKPFLFSEKLTHALICPAGVGDTVLDRTPYALYPSLHLCQTMLRMRIMTIRGFPYPAEFLIDLPCEPFRVTAHANEVTET